MDIDEQNGINFVSRSRDNLGVFAKVRRIDDVDPLPEGTITVTLGGTYLLSSFIQEDPYYTAQNIKVLTSKEEMSFNVKLYYTLCISQNRFKYSTHGREANKSLDSLLVPDLDSVPEWVNYLSIKKYEIPKDRCHDTNCTLNSTKWKWYSYDQLFFIKKGKRLTKKDIIDGNLPFIASIKENNGVRQYIQNTPLHDGNTITVNYNGSVGEAFYQENPYWASDDVNILYPKFNLNKFIGLFLVTLIRKEIYRFNYGRKWHLERMIESKIKLPSTSNGDPNWSYMEKYMKMLPYSKSLC
jgi:hypothetical protein